VLVISRPAEGQLGFDFVCDSEFGPSIQVNYIIISLFDNISLWTDFTMLNPKAQATKDKASPTWFSKPSLTVSSFHRRATSRLNLEIIRLR
jgi:hypothetical protein